MYLLFDLDGTLTDSFLGISNCIQHALHSIGRPSLPPERMAACIGPPLRETFVRLLGPEEIALADEAVAKYRERYASVGMFENRLYSGIPEALGALKERGHRLGVATSKPLVFAKRIIDHFELSSYFDSVDGSALDGALSNKSDLIAHVLKREAIGPVNAVMIGDREYDMIGACSNGVSGVGVLWGYGSRDELRDAGAVACVESPSDLVDAVAARWRVNSV